ncbi:amidase [Proteobacteria bacterium 005FR1]|nr:amidase [Proteobacteria bacterium 005FR1]
MQLAYRSAREIVQMIQRGELTSEAALEAMLARIERLNPDLNAVIYLDADRARERAREADQATARGESWGPLHGLPMTIKETYEVTGMPTSAGATELRDHRPDHDAVAAQRLIDAGAIIIGKTNVPLYAGDLQSYNEIYGTTNNPWDPKRTPGGSSGGAAAALVAGLTPLEYGSDIGGSIRTPASFCGVYGHKPSFDLVPARGHIPGPPGSLTRPDIGVMGPLARNVDDLQLALEVTAGPDSDDATGWKLQLPPARHTRLQDYRVAAWLDDPACPVEGEIVERLQLAVTKLREAGVDVDESARPAGIELAEAYGNYYSLLIGAIGSGMPERVFEKQRSIAAEAGPDDRSYKVRFARGATQSHGDWLAAHEKRLQMRQRWAEFFKDVDILLCPVTNTLPFPHDHSNPIHERQLQINGKPTPYTDILVWVGLVGGVYLPSTVIPLGTGSSGLPIGVQIVGPYLEDMSCLEFARHLDDLINGFAVPPGYQE